MPLSSFRGLVTRGSPNKKTPRECGRSARRRGASAGARGANNQHEGAGHVAEHATVRRRMGQKSRVRDGKASPGRGKPGAMSDLQNDPDKAGGLISDAQ